MASTIACQASAIIGQGAEAADEAAIARFFAAGHELPAWAGSESVAHALGKLAQDHGLPLETPVAAMPGARVIGAALHLARMLTQGAVSPQSAASDWFIPQPRFDREATLAMLTKSADPLPWLKTLAPAAEQYGELRQALRHYRRIAAAGGWPLLPGGTTLGPGSSDRRVSLLRQRLALEGDLAIEGASGSTFDDTLEDAVHRFQTRHGLVVDGRVGSDTLAALNVDAAARVAQIEANLERWRWLPHVLPGDRIMVNVAAAQLTLFLKGRPVLTLRAVVGVKKHPTPVFAATLTSLLLNPPWDIPSSIARREILPRARRDPEFLAREGIISRGADGRLRQLPGPKNPLGQIKFEMPNPLDVYLHDTSSKELLRRARRFFSHGCIRVDDPRRLALALLDRREPWTEAELDRAIREDGTHRIPIKPLPVYVTYFTSGVGPTGAVSFYDDVYGRDAPLVAAFSALRAASPGPAAAADRPGGCGAARPG